VDKKAFLLRLQRELEDVFTADEWTELFNELLENLSVGWGRNLHRVGEWTGDDAELQRLVADVFARFMSHPECNPDYATAIFHSILPNYDSPTFDRNDFVRQKIWDAAYHAILENPMSNLRLLTGDESETFVQFWSFFEAKTMAYFLDFFVGDYTCSFLEPGQEDVGKDIPAWDETFLDETMEFLSGTYARTLLSRLNSEGFRDIVGNRSLVSLTLLNQLLEMICAGRRFLQIQTPLDLTPPDPTPEIEFLPPEEAGRVGPRFRSLNHTFLRLIPSKRAVSVLVTSKTKEAFPDSVLFPLNPRCIYDPNLGFPSELSALLQAPDVQRCLGILSELWNQGDWNGVPWPFWKYVCCTVNYQTLLASDFNDVFEDTSEVMAEISDAVAGSTSTKDAEQRVRNFAKSYVDGAWENNKTYLELEEAEAGLLDLFRVFTEECEDNEEESIFLVYTDAIVQISLDSSFKWRWERHLKEKAQEFGKTWFIVEATCAWEAIQTTWRLRKKSRAANVKLLQELSQRWGRIPEEMVLAISSENLKRGASPRGPSQKRSS
jgi:hypothetical protein